MKIKKPKTPLVVVVENGRWAAFGEPTSYRQHFLTAMLTLTGGVNECVPDGAYYFNTAGWTWGGLILVLQPIHD